MVVKSAEPHLIVLVLEALNLVLEFMTGTHQGSRQNFRSWWCIMHNINDLGVWSIMGVVIYTCVMQCRESKQNKS